MHASLDALSSSISEHWPELQPYVHAAKALLLSRREFLEKERRAAEQAVQYQATEFAKLLAKRGTTRELALASCDQMKPEPDFWLSSPKHCALPRTIANENDRGGPTCSPTGSHLEEDCGLDDCDSWYAAEVMNRLLLMLRAKRFDESAQSLATAMELASRTTEERGKTIPSELELVDQSLAALSRMDKAATEQQESGNPCDSAASYRAPERGFTVVREEKKITLDGTSHRIDDPDAFSLFEGMKLCWPGAFCATNQEPPLRPREINRRLPQQLKNRETIGEEAIWISGRGMGGCRLLIDPGS